MEEKLLSYAALLKRYQDQDVAVRQLYQPANKIEFEEEENQTTEKSLPLKGLIDDAGTQANLVRYLLYFEGVVSWPNINRPPPCSAEVCVQRFLQDWRELRRAKLRGGAVGDKFKNWGFSYPLWGALYYMTAQKLGPFEADELFIKFSIGEDCHPVIDHVLKKGRPQVLTRAEVITAIVYAIQCRINGKKFFVEDIPTIQPSLDQASTTVSTRPRWSIK